MIFITLFFLLTTTLNHSLSFTATRLQRVLVCGDGDLSYSASIAGDLADKGISLVASVLEDREKHHSVYEESQTHCEHISSCGNHEVKFNVDATDLVSSFKDTKFDQIQFNFPHWRGKMNHKRNRKLLSDFFMSAADVLSPGGEVHVALCEGQGGVAASNAEEFRQSWKAAQFAAEHGFLLKNVLPYEVKYNLSSHRGVDRPFRVGQHPELYIFGFPDGTVVEERCQLCCRHELHVLLPGADNPSKFSDEDLIHGNAIQNIIKTVIPDGIHFHIPIRRVLSSEESGCDETTVVYLVVYCGETIPLTRAFADKCRSDVEDEVGRKLQLRANRMGRLVSRPFHFPVLKPDTLLWFSSHQ